MTRARRAGDAGLTLVEMLVALTLFAFIAVAGLTVLDAILRVQRGTEDRLAAIGALDRAFRIVARDAAHKTAEAAATDGTGGLAWVRTSAAGPVLVRYATDGQSLVRAVALADAPAVTQPLVSGVEALSWRFLGPDGLWHDTWPPEAVPAEALRAVEMALTLGGPLGAGTPVSVRRVLELP